MSRTLSIKHGSRGTGDWASGWHLVTIHSAKYSDWEGNKFLNLTFKDYPENFNLRLYAKIGTNGEEFVIGNPINSKIVGKISTCLTCDEIIFGSLIPYPISNNGTFTKSSKIAPSLFKK